MPFEIGRLVSFRGHVFPIVGKIGSSKLALLVEGNSTFMKNNPACYYAREKDHHINWNYDPKYIGKAVYCIYIDKEVVLYEKRRCGLCRTN